MGSRTTFVNTARRSIVNELGNKIDIAVTTYSQSSEVVVKVDGPTSTCEHTFTLKEGLSLMDCLSQSMMKAPLRNRG